MNNLVAQAVGAVALAFNVGSYQLKSSRMLVLGRAIGDFIYIFHYLLLGAYSGCITVGICALNGVIFSFKGNAWAEWKGWKWLLSAVMIATCAMTWRGSFQPLPHLCSLVSILVTMWTAWSGNGKVIRLGRLFVSGPTWITYCLFVGSIPGMLSEAIGMGSVLVSIGRYGLKNLDNTN